MSAVGNARIKRITEMEAAFERVADAVKAGFPLSPQAKDDIEKLGNCIFISRTVDVKIVNLFINKGRTAQIAVQPQIIS